MAARTPESFNDCDDADADDDADVADDADSDDEVDADADDDGSSSISLKGLGI